MLALIWPLAWLMFLPVVAVEAWVGTKALRLPMERAVRLSLWANGISTVAGIPLTWCLLLILEMALLTPIGYLTRDFPTAFAVTLGAPWIPPLEHQDKWQVALAGIWLTVFFAAASIWVEQKVVRRVAPDLAVADVRRWAYQANVLSYTVFVAAILVWWAYPTG
jgi:hypothetical protein